MGTEFKLVVSSADAASARRASRAAFDRVAALDAILSDYKVDSELNRLCAQAGGPPVPVSADLYGVLAEARAIAELSQGAFDPTIRPLVKHWRRARRQRALPDPVALAEARALVGYEHLILDPEARTVRLARPGMLLDLGGIAKGHAAHAALAVLREHGLGQALVGAAGDIVVGAPPPDQDGWRVGIAPVEDPDARPEAVLALRDAAISTSGDSAQYVEIGGRRYSHIVDPRTGLGVVERAAVTLVGPLGTNVDSLATAVSILGPQRGLALVARVPGVEARIVRLDDRSRREVLESPGWSGLPRAEPADSPAVPVERP